MESPNEEDLVKPCTMQRMAEDAVMCEPFSAVNREECRESVLSEAPACQSAPRIQLLSCSIPCNS
jgi:hypothetical protein